LIFKFYQKNKNYQKNNFLNFLNMVLNIFRSFVIIGFNMKEINIGRETGKTVKNLVAVGLLSISLSSLAACSSLPAKMRNPEFTPTPVVQQATVEPEETPSQFTTDWHTCTTIQPGEGIIAALNREAGGQNPKEPYKFVESTVEVMDSNGKVTVYNWENLLKENPIVYPGDKVCHTIKPILGQTATPRPEDIQR
jgi:hypothetical protein